MNSQPKMDTNVRDRILSDPEILLEDAEVMRALVAANDRAMGPNIVDLRGVAMARLEERLDRLEDTHRSVIAAAYENLAGTNQIHRAVIRLLDADSFDTLLADLGAEIRDILRVDVIRLVLESAASAEGASLKSLRDVVRIVEPGRIDGYLTQGRAIATRPVTLRQIEPKDDAIYGPASAWVRSEACLKLDFGAGRLPGLLVLGAEDPHQFTPQQGPDLLIFFASVFERTMRRWLG